MEPKDRRRALRHQRLLLVLHTVDRNGDACDAYSYCALYSVNPCFLMNIFFHYRPCIRKKRHMRHQRHRKTDTLAGPRRPVTYRAVLSLLYPKPSRVSRSLRPLWLIVCLMPFPCAQFIYASKTSEAFEQASGSRSQTSSTNCAT